MAGAIQLPLLDYSQAAQELGVSPQTLRRLVEGGQIQPIRLGRRVLFSPTDLSALVTRRSVATAPEAA